jgi:hypothetical protein
LRQKVTDYFDNNNFNNIVGGENTVCLPVWTTPEFLFVADTLDE